MPKQRIHVVAITRLSFLLTLYSKTNIRKPNNWTTEFRNTADKDKGNW